MDGGGGGARREGRGQIDDGADHDHRGGLGIDRRGRERGEIAGLLREGLIAGGLDPARIEVKYEEDEAINYGLDLLGEDDLLVIHADRVASTLAAVRRRTVHNS